MVLAGTKPRGLADDPDQVLRSGGRMLFLTGAAFLVAVGLLFALGGRSLRSATARSGPGRPSRSASS